MLAGGDRESADAGFTDSGNNAIAETAHTAWSQVVCDLFI